MIVSNSSFTGYTLFTFYLPLIFTILSLIAGLFMLIAQIKFIRMRIYSGKLLLHTIILQIILTILFLMSLFYVVTGQATSSEISAMHFKVWIINSFPANLLGGIETYIAFSYYFYHLCIAHNLYFSTKKYNKGDFRFRFKRYLAISHLLALVITVIALASEKIGLQNVGILGISMSSDLQYVFLVVLAVILPFSVFSICFSLFQTKRMDKELQSEKLYEKEVRHDFVSFNCQLLIVFILTWMPYALVSLLGLFDKIPCACLVSGSDFLNAFKVTSLNLLAMSPFLNALLRLFRPMVRRDLALIFKCYKTSAGNQLPLLDRNDGQPLEQEITTRGMKNIRVKNKGSELGSSFGDRSPRSTNYTNQGTMIQSTKTLDLSMSEIFVKKKKPKKPISLPELLDIMLVFLSYIRDMSQNKSHVREWEVYHYSSVKKEEVDPNAVFNQEEREYILAVLQKSITFHNICSTKYAGEVFGDLRSIWNISLQNYKESFAFKENVEYCVKSYKKRYSHLEKRYCYMTRDKKYLLQLFDKESKIFFVDKFLSEFHQYIQTNPSTLLFRPVELMSFCFNNVNHNIMAMMNPYELLYTANEEASCDIPLSISERYLLDGKYFRHEIYDPENLKKIKTPTPEVKDPIFSLPSDCKREVLDLIKKDLSFLDKLGVINYKVIFVVVNNEDVIKKIKAVGEGDYSHNKKKFINNGFVNLSNGSMLKIFIEMNLVTSEMKGVEMKRYNPMFSMDSSDIYRQLIEEVVNGIL